MKSHKNIYIIIYVINIIIIFIIQSIYIKNIIICIINIIIFIIILGINIKLIIICVKNIIIFIIIQSINIKNIIICGINIIIFIVILLDPNIGPKSIGSCVRIHFPWVLGLEPIGLGLALKPKRNGFWRRTQCSWVLGFYILSFVL